MTDRKRKIYETELGLQRTEDEGIERGSPVFYSGPSFAQIPIDLLQDGSVIGNHVRLYADYHSFCKLKKLNQAPFTFVSQKTLARDWMAGCSQPYVAKLTKELQAAGWLTTIRQGLGRSNIIILHYRKGQRISSREKGRCQEVVRKYFRRLNEDV